MGQDRQYSQFANRRTPLLKLIFFIDGIGDQERATNLANTYVGCFITHLLVALLANANTAFLQEGVKNT